MNLIFPQSRLLLSIALLFFSIPFAGAQIKIASDTTLIISAVTDGYPMVSSDGKRIVFQSDRMGSNDIYTMDLDGANLYRLTFDQANDRTPSWSPDGKKIVFVSTRDGNYDVFVMDSSGKNQKNLTKNHEAKDIHPYWAPDGKKILFNSSRIDDTYDLYTMNIDGSEQFKIRKETGEATHAQYSPDGKMIAFRKFITTENSNSEIFVMNADGSSERRLTHDKAFDYAPAWSSDGNFLAFVSDREKGYDAVYIMNSKGGAAIALDQSNTSSTLTPCWITNDQLIVSNQSGPSITISLIKFSISEAN